MKRWRTLRFNITIQFILYMAFVSVIPLVLVGVFAYMVSFSIIQKQVSDFSSALITDQKDYLDVHLQEVESLIANISGVEDIIHVINDQGVSTNVYTNLATQARIGYILNNYINLKGLISIDIFTAGGAHYHVGETLQVDNINAASQQRIFDYAQKSDSGIVWTGIEDNINGDSAHKKVITAAKLFAPINSQDAQAKPTAMLIVNYSPDFLYDHFAQIQLGQGAYLMVIDNQNRVIYHPNQNILGDKVSAAFIARMVGNRGSLTTDIDGQSMVISYSRSENSHWIVASFTPVATLSAQTAPIGVTTMILLGVCFVVVGSLTWRYNQNLVSPVRQITQTFKRFEEGTLETSTRLQRKGNDEISELVQWFNAFLDTQAEKRRTDAELQSRQHYLTLLNDITLAALGTPDLDAMLKTLAGRLGELFKADGCYILLLGTDNQEAPAALYGAEGQVVGLESSTGRALMPIELADIDEPLVIADANSSPLISQNLVEYMRAGSLLALPLRSANQNLGVALIISSSAHPYSQEEIALGEQAARQISLAVAKTYLLDEIKDRARVFETLYQTASDLANLDTVHMQLESILQHAMTVLNTRAGFIYLYDREHKNLRLTIARGLDWEPGISLEIGEGLAGMVALERRPIRLDDYSTWEHRSEKFDKLSIGSAAAVPLVWGNRLIGVLGVGGEAGHLREYTEGEMRQLSLVARLGTSAVNNTFLLEELRQFNEMLEQRVASRTAELEKANLNLEGEILERSKMEEALKVERSSLAQRVAERTFELSMVNAHLAQAVRAKDEFLANMSHELRTPLNAVLGMSEALEEEVYGPLNAKQIQFIKTIEESGKHLLSLINDILDLSKIEAGKLDIQSEWFTVGQLCQSSLQFVRQAAMKKNIRVALDLEHAPEEFWADERRMKQILVNLLTNAVKFTPEGGEVGLIAAYDAEQESVRFTVWDTGIGITPEDREKLFKPFVQIDSGLARHHEGTGLGLALVAKLTEIQGGSIGLESEPGKGSRFMVNLPMPHQSEISKTGSLHRGRQDEMIQQALVIEDSVGAAETIVRLLRGFGLETRVITRGQEAIQDLLKDPEGKKPDVIFLDLLLPDISGWEVLQQLKAETHTRSIPVVIASVMEESVRAKAMGAVAYLIKPINRAALEAALELTKEAKIAAAFVPAPVQQDGETHPLVLLAEDNDTNIMAMQEYLKFKGFRVAVARNGTEAIEMTELLGPDLILMDIQMPGMDGLEATRRIRGNSALKQAPIVALTALAMPGDRERCLEAGANDYLSKPVSLKKLVMLIHNMLNMDAPE
jgi:signal transduction histidine kinase/CheY-like chemotaxis protein